MNPNLSKLQLYPFEKLAALKNGITPPKDKKHIPLSIGEPKHEPPTFVLDRLKEELSTITNYPLTNGLEELRESIAQWITRRFCLKETSISRDHNIIPVSGTREALFSFTQAVVNSQTSKNKVLMPNPFYQIYEGAAILAGAIPHFINCHRSSNFLPDFNAVDNKTWEQCQLLFICSPGNPTGSVLSIEQLIQLIKLADKYNFVIASDECYSELYFDESQPPPGLLEACSRMGRHDYERCVVFHSLSKRSNLPGLRSGFVAGDATLIKQYLHYRTYHGCALPLFSQKASIAAWEDEQHVLKNRDLYREKFDAVLNILDGTLSVDKPEASFYLWPQTPISDTTFAQQLFARENVTVLPGSFLARTSHSVNPGSNYVRMALVAPLDECIEAAHRIKNFVKHVKHHQSEG